MGVLDRLVLRDEQWERDWERRRERSRHRDGERIRRDGGARVDGPVPVARRVPTEVGGRQRRDRQRPAVIPSGVEFSLSEPKW